MAHPMKKSSVDGHNAKLRMMTTNYGSASGPANNKLAPPNMEKGEGPEEASGFGAEAGTPRPRADRARRISNPIATYAKGGAVAGRAMGGRAKKGKGKGATHVNVIVAPQSGAGGPPPGPMPMPPIIPPAAAAPPPMAPKPPMGLPPGAAGLPMAPGAPGGMPPGLVPPRAKGGRVHADAAEDKALIEKTLKDEGLVRRARGGKVHMTAGAASGEGRLEKAELQSKHKMQSQTV